MYSFPLVAGMWTAQKFPKFTSKITKPIRILSIFIFGGYIVAALTANWEFFVQYVQFVILLVLIHNAVALSSGYGLGVLARLPGRDRRT